MLTTETRPIEEQRQVWQPHPTSLGKWDGYKGYLPTEEYLFNEQYQKGYFEGIHSHYQSRKQSTVNSQQLSVNN